MSTSKDALKRKRKSSEVDGGPSGPRSNDVTDIRAKKMGGFQGEVTHSKGRTWKSVKQIYSNENTDLLPPEVPTYFSIEAPPSTIPAKKYCDLTGFPVRQNLHA